MAKRDYSKLSKQKILQLAQDPGNRSKIPTRYLPQQYRARRAENTRLAQPVTPGSDMTVRDAETQRNALVEQKYGDAVRSSQAQTQAIPQWYQNFRDQIAIANQARQAGYQAAAQAFQGLQAGTTAQQGQQETQQYAQQQQALGGIADPAAAQRAAQAAAIRGAAVGDLGSVLAAQGASQQAYGASQYATAGQSQIEALQKELDNQRQLQIQKGAFGAQTDADIKANARKEVLENKAFGLQVANTQADNAVAAANAQTSRINARTSRENAANATAGPGGTYSRSEWARMTPAQRTKAVADFKNATKTPGAGPKPKAPPKEPGTSLQPRRLINARVGFVKQYLKDHNMNLSTPQNRAQVVAALRKDHPGFFDNGGNQENVLRAALDLANGGPISSGTLSYLRKQGVYVSRNGSYAPATNH